MYAIKIIRYIFFITSLVILCVCSGRAQVSEAEKLYEQGIYQLEAIGNFEEAINIFTRVVNEYSSEKEVAADALLKLGLCYERQGSQKAEEAYTRIIEKFSDQSRQVAQARERLAALREQYSVAGQTIKLNYREGFEDGNSLSSDGTRMAIIDYSVGQNVAYYDFTTNKKVLLTHYNWYNYWTYYAIWSPDDKEIAYIKAGMADIDPNILCISDLEGNEKILYTNPAPGSKIYPDEWLPDGKGIVVVLQDSTGFTLGIVPLNGGNIETVKKLEAVSAVSVSPDGRYIVYTEGPMGSRDIKIIDRISKKILPLTDNPANDGSPKWSPDGNYIVFKSNRHGDYAIWGVKVKDGQPLGPPFMIMPGARDVRFINWTPAGLALKMVIQTIDIYEMPVNPVTGKSLGKPALIRYTPTGSNFNPVWAPDGLHFAFGTQNRENGQAAVEIMSVDYSEKREFLLPPNQRSGSIRWTPDGEAIGFIGNDGTENYNLMRLTIKTGKWESWPLGIGYWAMLEWGKDGETYYFSDNGLHSEEKIVKCSTGSSERHNIYPEVMNGKGAFRTLKCSRDYKNMAIMYGGSISVMNLETEKTKLVTPAADTVAQSEPKVSWMNPAWSPDGTKLMVTKNYSDESNKPVFELYILNLETGELQMNDLGNALPRDTRIVDLDWSPDGKNILLCCYSVVLEDNLMKTVIPIE